MHGVEIPMCTIYYSTLRVCHLHDISSFSRLKIIVIALCPIYRKNIFWDRQANQTVPNVQRSIVELGTVLKEITFRKQFEVEVTRPGLKTSMERVPVDREIDRKNLKIKFDSPKRDEDEYLQVIV